MLLVGHCSIKCLEFNLVSVGWSCWEHFYFPLNGMLVHRWNLTPSSISTSEEKKMQWQGQVSHHKFKEWSPVSWPSQKCAFIKFLMRRCNDCATSHHWKLIPSGDLCHFPDCGIRPVGEMLLLPQWDHKNNNYIHVKQDSFKCWLDLTLLAFLFLL